MSPEEAIRALDALDNDPEGDHIEADRILAAVVPPEVAAACEEAKRRCGGWWYA